MLNLTKQTPLFFIGTCAQSVGDEFNFEGRWVVCTACAPVTYKLNGVTGQGFRISYILAP